jgi:hypothetical protein
MSELDTLEKPEATEATKPSPRKVGWRWQWLIAPLMGISILLHIALLFVPLPTQTIAGEDAEETETSEADEEGPIDILSLSDIAAPEPPPEPPPEQPQQQPQQQAPPPAGAVPPPPDPEQVVEDLPAEEDVFEEELPIDEGLGDAPPSFDTGAATDQFIGDISGLGVVDYTSEFGLPTPDLLRNPGHAACFIDPSGGAVAGVRVANWLDKEPQTLLRENLQDVYGPRGITFNEMSPFCGERYFQAFTAEGQPFMTFSLVQLQGSTLLIVWETPPQ